MKTLRLFEENDGEKKILIRNVKFHKTQGGLIFLTIYGDNKQKLDDLLNIPPADIVITFRG